MDIPPLAVPKTVQPVVLYLIRHHDTALAVHVVLCASLRVTGGGISLAIDSAHTAIDLHGC